jgi:hypothetical protein
LRKIGQNNRNYQAKKNFGFEWKHIQHRNISLENKPANFIAEKWVKIA